MSTYCYVRCAACDKQSKDGLRNDHVALMALVDQAPLLCLLFKSLESNGFEGHQIWDDSVGYSSNFHFAIEHAPHQRLEVVNEYGRRYEWKIEERKIEDTEDPEE